MHFHVVLNRDGGTLRTIDLEVFSSSVATALQEAGHTSDIEMVEGKKITEALEAAAAGKADIVMAGGGDGTISCAAALLMDSDKALAVLPAGTMNLFARTLKIPLQLDAAVAALSKGEVTSVDLASANGKVFVHQLSIGLHAKLIRLREKRSFASRLGKMRASMQAAVDAFLRPPRMRLELDFNDRKLTVVTSGIGVTNNLFGEGHLPFTDTPDGGVLGIYVTRARSRRELMKFLANLAIGRWEANDQVDIHETRQLRIELPKRHKRFGCAMDGELCELPASTLVRIHPGALKVVVPTGT